MLPGSTGAQTRFVEKGCRNFGLAGTSQSTRQIGSRPNDRLPRCLRASLVSPQPNRAIACQPNQMAATVQVAAQAGSSQ